MAVNKVEFGGNTLIDLTSDTVSAADVASGRRFHLPNGEQETGTLKCQIIEFTLAAHQSTNVTIGTLSDEAYAHINDDNFSVSMINTTPSGLENYDDFFVLTQNNAELPKMNAYTIYGVGARKTGASAVQYQFCYYPPNSTDNTTGIGGVGKIWHNGKTLYYKSASYFLGAGTYRVVITW